MSNYYNKQIRHDLTMIHTSNIHEGFVKSFNKRILIQIHVYFIDILDEIIQSLNFMPFSYDLWISTDSEKKKAIIESKIELIDHCLQYKVDVYENRGRDVLPFLKQVGSFIENYDYICHLHTKKSETVEWGDAWRHHLYQNLFGSTQHLCELFSRMEEDEHLGLVMPEVYPLIQLAARWNGTKDTTQTLLADMGIAVTLPDEPIFPAGTMFWAKSNAVHQIFELDWSQYDFPDENGQIDFTPAHAIERIWVYLVNGNGYDYEIVHNAITVKKEEMKNKKRLLIYSSLKKNGFLDMDIETIKKISDSFETIIFATDYSHLNVDPQFAKEKIVYAEHLKKHKSFEIWREHLSTINLFDYDQLVLMDNSCFGPVYPIEEIIQTMDDSCDALALYGMQTDQNECILKSNFLFFNQAIIHDNRFQSFFGNGIDSIKCTSEFEFRLSRFLKHEGFSFRIFCIESLYLGKMLNVNREFERLPYDFIVLNCPFIMKESTYTVTDAVRKACIDVLKQMPNTQVYADFYNTYRQRSFFDLLKLKLNQLLTGRGFFY
ncbi:hypothetical protein GSF08_03420 [Clostridiaceae bacterium DONG20-135]|uniref:Rhamnan synthesis protein F n=1 Tax=Copranaerobaculum intestinale TaxID=2692629 RepID=A0A6N8U6Q7_9FIRM|nr:rhamnan synthesis F family protein [Copranaerobaculum intestinale]MXQ72984.1 hypothetical protein [Copranaerobaculum intestinale]